MARCKRAMKVVIWAFSSVAKNRGRYPPLLLERCARITMGAARAAGCRASLIGRDRRYGKPFESPTGEVEGDMRERKPKFGAPGKLRPAVFALKSPKASAPRLHQRNVGGENLLTGCLPKTQAAMRCGGAALRPRTQKRSPLDGRAGRGLTADFFGASPVASALGVYARRDPGVTRSTYHGWSRRPLQTGTFYFAGKRNFLFCLDTELPSTQRRWQERLEKDGYDRSISARPRRRVS